MKKILMWVVEIVSFWLMIGACSGYMHHIHVHHHHRYYEMIDIESNILLSRNPCHLHAIPNCTMKVLNLEQVNFDNQLGMLLDEEKAPTYLVAGIPHNQQFDWNRLDNILIHRPWWIVTNQLVANISVIISFVKAQDTVKNVLLAFMSRNFPSASDCEKKPLVVSIHDGDTWGNRFVNLKNEVAAAHNHYAVFLVYTTRDGTNNSPVYFSSPEDCLTYVNKWECLFLPTTNCSTPTSLAQCNKTECLPPLWGYGVYNSASSVGRLLPQAHYDKFLSLRSTIINEISSSELGNFLTMKSSSLPYLITKNATIWRWTSMLDIRLLMEFAGVIARFNSAFRARVQALVTEFRGFFDPPFSSDTSCIAIHIRRDDRAMEEIDIIAWCAQCSVFDKQGRRESYRGNCETYTEGSWYDMGCHTQLPFGLATLEHFLNASLALNDTIRNVFVMTDDLVWLNNARKELVAGRHARSFPAQELTIRAYPLRPNHRLSSLSNAEDFWASVTLAQQCSGFVGHFGSAATQYVFNTMCWYHNFEVMKCPPVYDIGGCVW